MGPIPEPFVDARLRYEAAKAINSKDPDKNRQQIIDALNAIQINNKLS